MIASETIPVRAWKRVKWTRAGQLAAYVDGLSDFPELTDQEPARAFADLRCCNPQMAAHFVAQCLPRLDAVQWIAACLACSQPGTALQQEARAAVERWIRDPSDKLRRLAYETGEAVGWDKAEGAACLAVFLSGGSLAPAEQDVPVNAGPGVFGQATAGAVLMAALAHGPAQFAASLDAFLDMATRFAAGEVLP